MALFDETVVEAIEEWAGREGIPSFELTRILHGTQRNTPGPGTRSEQSPTVFFPGLRARSFWEPADFAWGAELERASSQIAAEFFRNEGPTTHQPIRSMRTDRGTWSVNFLTMIGRPKMSALARFPATKDSLENVPGALSCGMAYFSTIVSGTHILPHVGFTNAHLRCHLTLSPGGDGCRIRVGSETRSWIRGKLLIFDDTFEHEVWNDSAEDRTVLLFDIFHPDLSAVERRALELMARIWRRAIVSDRLSE